MLYVRQSHKKVHYNSIFIESVFRCQRFKELESSGCERIKRLEHGNVDRGLEVLHREPLVLGTILLRS